MRAGFIGAGKVGFSLGRYLAEGGVTVTGYYSRNSRSAREAAEFTGTDHYEDLDAITADSDTLFITVPDGAIAGVWDQLRDLPIKDKNICHCSGSISSTVFFDAEDKGACAYSVHPLYAVSDRYHSYKKLGNAVFSVEGSEKNLDVVRKVFEGMGNDVEVIDGDRKSLYHCAAVMVSNHMAALADIGSRMLEQCGFSHEAAGKALAPLISGNADAIAARGVEDALTGPVERGDCETVKKHLGVLEGDIRELYRILSENLVTIAERKHPDRDYEELKKELQK